MKKLLKRIFILLMILTQFFNIASVYAAKANTLRALKSDLSNLETQKRKNDNAKKQTESQIDQSKQGIYSSQKEITTNQGKIESAKVKIEESKVEIANQQSAMQEVIAAYQLADGNNQYLEYVFAADNITDLVYRFSVSEQLIEWQQTEIDKFEGLIKEKEQLQVDLANREIQLNKQIDGLENKISSLGNQLSEFTEVSMDLGDEIRSAKEYIKFVEKAGCEEDQDIDYCLRVITDTGFRRPVQKGRITSGFGYRVHPTTGKLQSFHNAIDIGGNAEGTKVFSAAAGTVGKIIKRASCGGNSVYIWHTVNGKKFTTQYTHLLSIYVSVGDTVTSETAIGAVGGGSTARSNGGYDSCTTGTHLHFAMAEGHYGGTGSNSYSSYSTYLVKCFDAQKYLSLPAKGVTFSGR